MRRSFDVCVFGLLVHACTSDTPVPGLQVRVIVTNPTVATGGAYVVRAVVVNRGANSEVVVERDGGIPFLDGMICSDRPALLGSGAWLAKLAPGDSIVQYETTPPVASAPGDYTLAVSPFANPAVFVSSRVHRHCTVEHREDSRQSATTWRSRAIS